MKKLMFIVMAATLLCACCSEIKLTSGSYKALSQQTGTAEFVLDLSKTQVVEYSPYNPFAANSFTVNHIIGTIDERNAKEGEDFVRDWPAVRSEMEKTFVRAFNRKYGRKGTTLCLGQGTTSYRVVFHVERLDFGSTGANIAAGVVEAVFGSGSFYGGGAGGCIVEGTIELQDIKSGKVLGVISITPFKTDGFPGETIRLCELMNECGKWAGKRAKK